MSIGMTKKDLADAAGYSYHRLHDIEKTLPEEKKFFVPSGGGKFDLAIFVQRWVDYNVEKHSDSAPSLDDIKAEHEAVKMQKTELEVDRMRGSLIDVQDVRRLWGDTINTATQKFIHLASRVAPLVLMMNNTERIADIIDTEIRRILTEISETPLPDYAADDIETEESEEDEEEDEEEV